MKALKARFTQIVVSAILFLMMLPSAAPAEEAAKILILPFNIFSQKDISFLKNGIWDMLSTRLSIQGKATIIEKNISEDAIKDLKGTITNETAILVAKKLGAAYVAIGSITEFGETISTDARLINASTGALSVTFNQTSKQSGDVIFHVNKFAEMINSKIFGIETETLAVSEKTPDQEISRMNPEKLWEMEKEKQMPVEEAPSSKQKFSFKKSKPHIKPEKKPYIEKTLHGLWKSNEFDFQIRGIASGDIDGDQNQELVVISEKDIYFFRFINGRMQSFHEIKGKRYFNLISISIGDINENGKAEIFVSNILTNNSRLNSSVLEWNGNGFDTIYIHSDWYYRVIRKDKKDILLGQKRGYESEIFTGPVYEMDYDSNGYSPAREILLPRKINLYMINSGDAFNDARNLFFTPSANNDRILILNESGQEQWSLPYPYGSKSVSIESAGFKYGKKDYYPIPLPAFIEDINNDGKNEVLVVQNTDLKVHFLKPAKTADAFHSEIFEGKKNGLELIFKTKDIEGYLSDYALADIDNDGKKELLCAVFIKTGRIMKKDNSFIVIHDLIKEE